MITRTKYDTEMYYVTDGWNISST